jgi:arylformamidase
MPESNGMRVVLDIPYLPEVASSVSTRQALDLYAPGVGKGLPVVAYIHGGGWRYGDRKEVHQKPAAFVARGCVFVSLGYRLVPEVRNREQCGDLALGLRWVRDHIAEYGGDRDRIHLVGHSAGAPLAASVVVDPGHLATAGVPLAAIRTVTGLDGDCYQISKQWEMVDAKTRAYHETVWGADPKGWEDPSPITHLRQGRSYPAFLLAHLTSRADSRWQAEAFAARCREVGASARVLAVGTTHEAMNEKLGCEGDVTTAEVYRFMAECACNPR